MTLRVLETLGESIVIILSNDYVMNTMIEVICLAKWRY